MNFEAMKKTKKAKPMIVAERIHGFRKRWSLELSEDARWTEFKDRFMNTFEDVVGFHFITIEGKEAEFYRLVGKHKRVKATESFADWGVERELLGSCPVYQLMLGTMNMPSSPSPRSGKH